MLSKESQLMRMPSDLRGADKHNPCIGCQSNKEGYCTAKNKWAFAVKYECIPAEPIKPRPPAESHPMDRKSKFGNREKEVICLDTNTKYRSAVIAQEQTGLCQSSISACCRGTQHSTKGTHWAFTGVVRKAGKEG